MNRFERYNVKNPVVSFRVEKKLLDTILDYMAINNISSIKKFMDIQLEEFKIRELEVDYKVKE